MQGLSVVGAQHQQVQILQKCGEEQDRGYGGQQQGDAKPVACHRVHPIPLHWQERVHRDFVRDVNLGVLEKLPTNTPNTWLSRMVLTSKSNGDPRRTVDYQPINKHVQRQIFPMETPFQLASRIPPGAKKTAVDNWNGFHSVSLHPDDWHYTAFLTQSGWYRYKVAAKGSMVSGDDFNERMDGIFTEFKDKVRCVEGGRLSQHLCQEQYRAQPLKVPVLPGHYRLHWVPDLPDQPYAL